MESVDSQPAVAFWVCEVESPQPSCGDTENAQEQESTVDKGAPAG